jgi:predicted nucleic acid-binding protein
MIVLDASAVVELLLRTPTGARVAARISAPEESLHVPHLLDLEVTQVLRRYEAMGTVPSVETRAALDELLALDVARYEHDLLLPRIWELRHNLTAYDASYMALAEALNAPLLTCDGALASVPGLHTRVELL